MIVIFFWMDKFLQVILFKRFVDYLKTTERLVKSMKVINSAQCESVCELYRKLLITPGYF